MSQSSQNDIIAIIGPTASGKTGKAVALAKAINGEIISGDSRQVYRRMTIGTGKDLDEYGSVPYHLIDICEPGEKYNLFRYLADAETALSDISSRGVAPIVCGGTGMYVEALLNGISLPEVPENNELRQRLAGKSLDELTEMLASMKTLHNVTDVDTVKRAVRAIEIATYYAEHPDEAEATRPRSPRPATIIGVDIDRESRRRKISSRLDSRLHQGMVDEVKSLIDSGVDPEALIYYGLEYKFVTLYILGQLTYDEMRSRLEIAIHQFAKRQMTWFRGMERRGHRIHWLDHSLPPEEFVAQVLLLSRPTTT